MDERTADGRFAPGNSGGPGRPRRATEREYLLAFQAACPPDALRVIAERAVVDAKGGDSKARDCLFRYLLGDPAKHPETFAKLAIDEALGVDPVDDQIDRIQERRRCLEEEEEEQRAREELLRERGLRPGTPEYRVAEEREIAKERGLL